MKSLLSKNNTYTNHSLQTVPLPANEGSNETFNSFRNKIFSAADLWNIQRQTKQRAFRRFI